ncbi:MAG: glycerophosphodiester phosphodiesterase family protein [Pseudomonadota bacterium]
MTSPVALTRADGHRVQLKWHMLRRQVDDIPFGVVNLRAGIAAGASIEIDIQRTADDDWVVLHDDQLDHETTGSGPVSALNSKDVPNLAMRAPDKGKPVAPVLLLSDVISELSASTPGKGLILQCDLKTPLAEISDAAAGRFCDLVSPTAEHCVLSGADWPAVEELGADVEGLCLGFDPLELFPSDWTSFPQTAAAMDDFVQRSLSVAPTARWIYLYFRLVLAAMDLGVDIVGRAQALGQKVDVWTLDPSDDSKSVVKRLVDLGTDQISTNAPDAWAAWWRSETSVA